MQRIYLHEDIARVLERLFGEAQRAYSVSQGNPVTRTFGELHKSQAMAM